jgi:hypothetical protein
MEKWISMDINCETGHNKPGIYRIILFKNGQPVKIPRFRKVDEAGVLVIGHSRNIEARRKQFIGALQGKHGHSEGIQLWLVKEFSDIIKESSLQFEFFPSESKEEAANMEKTEIQGYFKNFSEPQPLNSAIPQRAKWFDELRSGLNG